MNLDLLELLSNLWPLETAGGASISATEESAFFAPPDCDSAAVRAAHLNSFLSRGDLPAAGNAYGHMISPDTSLAHYLNIKKSIYPTQGDPSKSLQD